VTATETTTRIQDALAGFPTDVVTPRVRDRIVRFCVDLDAVGRLHGETGEPLIDAHTLRALLRPALGAELASDLVAMLEGLPQPCLRVATSDAAAPTEPGWYELAHHIVIYDTEPDTKFGDLDIAHRRSTEDVIAAVNYAFPSLEPELIDAVVVPPRIVELLRPGARAPFHTRLVELDRQLGWWAALVAVLLVPLAFTALEEPESGQSAGAQANAWPLGIYGLCAAVGGWTLTVAESVILAPCE
jgi:hypothetical protein